MTILYFVAIKIFIYKGKFPTARLIQHVSGLFGAGLFSAKQKRTIRRKKMGLFGAKQKRTTRRKTKTDFSVQKSVQKA